MFQVSAERFRAVRTRFEELVDDILAHPADDELELEPDPEPLTHPHRRPVRVAVDRRPGQVAPRPAHCLSPVRPRPDVERPRPSAPGSRPLDMV